jgi:hypothetical protein
MRAAPESDQYARSSGIIAAHNHDRHAVAKAGHSLANINSIDNHCLSPYSIQCPKSA